MSEPSHQQMAAQISSDLDQLAEKLKQDEATNEEVRWFKQMLIRIITSAHPTNLYPFAQILSTVAAGEMNESAN